MVYCIFNYFTGYVRIKIHGVNLEKVLNDYGITFWHVRRKRYTTMTACISLLAYKKLLKKEKHIKITLIREYGVQMIVKNIWENKIIFFGLCTCVFLLYFLSNLVLYINVSGHEHLDHDVIRQYAYDSGIGLFKFRWQLDLDKLNKDLLDKEEIAFASSGYDGVTLNIVIIESINKDDNTPGDIVAQRQAVITDMDVYSGNPLKKEGDVVNPGDIIISGYEQNSQGYFESVKSRGTIMGSVWEEGSYSLNLNGLNYSRTGNEKTVAYIDYFGYHSYINNEEIAFEHYEVEERIKKIGGSNSFLPIEYVEKTYYEIQIDENASNTAGIIEKLKAVSFEDGAQKMPKDAQIVDVKYTMNLEGDILTVNALVEGTMDIGDFVKISE